MAIGLSLGMGTMSVERPSDLPLAMGTVSVERKATSMAILAEKVVNVPYRGRFGHVHVICI